MRIKRIIPAILLVFILNQAISASDSLLYLNRILGSNEGELDKSDKHLSEGTYLLPDNPANHAIYEKLEAHIRGLEAIVRNNSDYISFYQTAEGYLVEVTDLLQNIRELIIRQSNAIYSDEDREYIRAEISQYYDQILFSLKNAEFNKNRIFRDLLNDDSIKRRFRQEDYFKINRVDEVLGFFINLRAMYSAQVATLKLRNQGMGVSSENMSGFQGSLWYIDMDAEISRLKKYHLLFIINLLQMRDQVR